ncbi:MAG: SAM-dependent methyltransferase [Bacilli bacterium]|nr:SAM-dependent methyltransferase [Bacilli bacterium]
MRRSDIINKIGSSFLTSNIENEEFSYQKALASVGKDITTLYEPQWARKYKNLDLRFTDGTVSVLIETKANYDNENLFLVYEQLNAYVKYERELTNNKIVAIIANTDDDRIMVFYGNSVFADNTTLKRFETKLKTFDEYRDIYFATANNKLKVIQSTYELNELLHQYGIKEAIRSQFVGTCLLALKNSLVYSGCTNAQIRAGIESVLTSLLERDLRKATKLAILKTKVLDSQDVKDLDDIKFRKILNFIETNILPYINDRSTQGQDLLNLFFTTFNKYVGKADKNQAFTPDHIVHFMCKVCGVNRNSYVLDPCCGSGAFLVRALTEAMDDCSTQEEKDEIKKKHIFGIEYEEGAFGLSTTNMLIHGDGNSNIIQGSCFKDLDDCVKDTHINVVLMNPPYNASAKCSNPSYAANWGSKVKTDPSKGLHYVHYIASKIKTGKLAVLLPMACAIGNDDEIRKFKQLMLQEHNLEAVFSLPNEVFYPGASVCACCMVFNLGVRHESAPIKETFFGYFKDDGFYKKKNLGRIERTNCGVGIWSDIEKEWLRLFNGRISKPGYSVVKKVGYEDEWLAEAYMETDYSTLDIEDFEKVVRSYLAFLVENGMVDKDGNK